MKKISLDAELKLDVIDRQLARVGPNCSWEEIFPDSLDHVELIEWTSASVERIDRLGKQIVVFYMALGRLMDVAANKPAEFWAGSQYRHYTDYKETELVKIRSNGSLDMARRMYMALHDVPMEQLQECPIGNLNAAAKLIQTHNYSDEQKRVLLANASKPRAEFEKAQEENSLVPPGEGSMRAVKLNGMAVEADRVEEWLERPDVAGLAGTDLGRIGCALDEFDSAYPPGTLPVTVDAEFKGIDDADPPPTE